MSIKLRAKLDNLLIDKDLHFDMTDDRKLAIKTKCGQSLVVFNDLVFAKKEPTVEEINFVKKVLEKEIDEINNKLKRLKELDENKPEDILVNKKWSKDDVYEVVEEGLRFDLNIKTRDISDIKIKVNSIDEIEDRVRNIDVLAKKAESLIKWREEKEEILRELRQNCNI